MSYYFRKDLSESYLGRWTSKFKKNGGIRKKSFNRWYANDTVNGKYGYFNRMRSQIKQGLRIQVITFAADS